MGVDGVGEGRVGFLRRRDGGDARALNADGLIFQFGASLDVDDGDVTDRGLGRVVLCCCE